jgi:DNA-binding transcriptional ArsR family regulator
MSRHQSELMAMDEKPAPCAVPGCDYPSRGGDIRGPGNERLSQYCLFHSQPVSLYGSLNPSACLKGLPRCKEMIQMSDTWMRILHLEERPPPQRCSEPAIANGLCIAHVAAGCASTIVDARACIKMWEGRPSLAHEPYTSDEAWRVLAEIDKIRQHGTSNSILPRNTTFVDAFTTFLYLAGELESPTSEQRVSAAFWMSPYSIGKTLGMEPREVRHHLRHLADTGYVELDQMYELPRSFIVTHEIRFPRKAYRAWRREKFRQRFPSPYMKTRIENLPRPNERVIEPVLDGSGILNPDRQGQVLALTERGRAELRSWELKFTNEKQQERRHRHELVLTMILIVLTSLLLISAISDAPHAWHVLQNWFIHRNISKAR